MACENVFSSQEESRGRPLVIRRSVTDTPIPPEISDSNFYLHFEKVNRKNRKYPPCGVARIVSPAVVILGLFTRNPILPIRKRP